MNFICYLLYRKKKSTNVVVQFFSLRISCLYYFCYVRFIILPERF